jgi:hypothetical protein
MNQTQALQVFEAQVATVENAFPSLFTKEDVIKVLRSLQQNLEFPEEDATSASFFTQETAEKLQDEIKLKFKRRLDSMSDSDLVDEDSIELSLYGRNIEIDSVSVNTDSIADELDDIVSDVLSKYVAEEKEKEEEVEQA